MAIDKQQLKEQLFGAEENSAAKLDPEKLGQFQDIAEKMYRTPQLSSREVASAAVAKAGHKLGVAIKDHYFYLYLINVLRIDMVYVASILALIAIYDVLNDPLMGIAYDRTRTRWGKSRPYVFLSPLLYFASTAMLFCGRIFIDNDDTSDPKKILFVFVLLFLRETFETIYKIPTDNFVSLISPNPQDRSSLVLWQTFSEKWSGDFVAAMFMPLLDLARSGIINISASYIFAFFGILSAFLGTIGTMMMAVKCRERIILQPQPAPTIKTLFYILKNKYRMRMFLADFLSSWWGAEYSWDVVTQIEIWGGAFRSFPWMIPRQTMQFVSIKLVDRFKRMFGGSYRKTVLFMRLWDLSFSVIPAVINMVFPKAIVGTWWKAGLLFAIFDGLRVSNDAPSAVLEKEIDREIEDYTEYMTGERPEGTVGLITGMIGRVMAPVKALVTIAVFRWTGYKPEIGAGRWSQATVRANITMYSRVFFLYTIGANGLVSGLFKNVAYFLFDLEGKKKEEMYAALNERRAMIAKSTGMSGEVQAMMEALREESGISN
ncbi:MAG: MFS transporter [Oscillospiraceae bacterium]|nr:MFS transporter [Oscillospiraceae bacterium]